ncbi:MAG: tRNA (adenosine(37)-N6)-threonylcarbamoyltransferase complex dimerization subunit type 1 TsaB [Bacilli bacterium]|nr:tRNA (adenosine(37)-N6)-threonylcarbamoyltransferase complex dimerization subunit type 1 TsaB [Bacilli bacterium]
MIYLYIDTSSDYLYTALSNDNALFCEKKIKLETNLSKDALFEITKMFEEVNISKDSVDKIIVCNGPGSFTGTRIGITIAKVWAWSKKVPITTTNSLLGMALSSSKKCIHVPLIDARRDHVYAAIYDSEYQEILKPSHILLTELMDKLSKLSDYEFISNDEFEDLEINLYNPDLFKIIEFTKNNKEINPHAVNPEYLKLTAAEEKKLND